MLPLLALPLVSEEPVRDEDPLVELPCEDPMLLDDEPPVPDVPLPVAPVAPVVELPEV